MEYINIQEMEQKVKHEHERKELESQAILKKINEQRQVDQKQLADLFDRAAAEERKEAEAKAKKEIETETAKLQTELEGKIKNKHHLESEESDDDLRQMVRELNASS